MGNMEPFEVGESLKLEEALRKTQPIQEGARPVETGESLVEKLEAGIRGAEVKDKPKKASPPQAPGKSQTEIMRNEASIIS
jgi:hypothetical protein